MLLALPLLLLPAAVRGLYDACGQTGSQSSHDAHPWAKPRYDDWWCGKHLAAVAELQAERAGNIEASVSISGGGSGAVRLVLFYGDSITAMYETSQAYAQLPYRTRGFGIGSDETKNLMWRVLNGEAPSGGVPADASVVLIGTNDISWVGDMCG